MSKGGEWFSLPNVCGWCNHANDASVSELKVFSSCWAYADLNYIAIFENLLPDKISMLIISYRYYSTNVIVLF